MKSLICTFLLFWVGNGSYAQSRYLFTLAELKQLANCPDKTCFQKAVLAKGYEFNKTEESTAAGNPITIYLYRILSTGQQPYYAEHLIGYADKGAFGRSVSFYTKSQAYPALLDADILREGYIVKGTANPDQARNYSHEDGGLIWMLTRNKPGFSPSKGAATYMVSLASFRKPASQRDQPVATQSAPGEPAHLGGDWDAKYPPRNAADLFRAERQYAADYDRAHGKAGHTFSRAEKCRIQAKFLDQYRPLTDERWDDTFNMALRTTGFDAFANDRNRLYKQEALFEVGSERVWMPVQEIWVDNLRKEAQVGQNITLYAVLVSHHDFGGTLHLSFLANEFAVSPKEASEASDNVFDRSPAPKEVAVAAAPRPVSTSSGPEDFKTFIQRFSTDKAFQLSRVKFPFKREGFYNYEEKPEIKYTQRIIWKHIDYTKPSPISDGNKGVGNWTAGSDDTKNSNTKSLGACGCAECGCGYSMGHTFQRTAGKWFLIKEVVVSN